MLQGRKIFDKKQGESNVLKINNSLIISLISLLHYAVHTKFILEE